MSLDLYIFNLINGFAGKNEFLDNVAVFFADYMQFALVAVLAVFIVKNFKKKLPVLISLAAAGFFARVIITEAIRYFFPKDRPFISESVNHILEHSASPSFPSGHASLFFALSAAVYFYNKKLGIFFFTSSFFISISRVFGGIHWPSDVIAGAVIGIFSGWLINKIFRSNIQKISEKFFKQKTPK